MRRHANKWLFSVNPKVVKRAARLHRLIRAGKLKPASKAQLRSLAEQAVQESAMRSAGKSRALQGLNREL
jgi:hypothetical protein